MVISLGNLNTEIASKEKTSAKKSFVLSYTEYNIQIDVLRVHYNYNVTMKSVHAATRDLSS